MEWWVWTVIGLAAGTLVVTAALVFALARATRSADQRVSDAAQDLVRMTDDLERRIHEARAERPRVEHDIEIHDEGRPRSSSLAEEFDDES